MSQLTLRNLRLAEIIGALSHALDMTEGQSQGHSERCCWIGLQLGEGIGMSTTELSDLYYTLLLKDLGCSSTAARVCELYLSDDRSFKKDFKTLGTSLPQILRFIVSHTGPSAPLAKRLAAMVNTLKHGGDIAQELIEARCYRGADIARQMRFSERVCLGITHLDEHWDGSGRPDALIGRAVPQEAQIALLAQVVDVFFAESGKDSAIAEINRRSGVWFAPDLVEVFNAVSDSDEFWATLADPGISRRILDMEPVDEVRLIDEDYLDDIALGFAKVIDAKSPFTGGHSERVAVYADHIAKNLGWTEDRRRWLNRAALLHDIGKLGISNTILDKPDKLSDDEFATIKLHPVFSGDILSQLSCFADIAEIGRGHHEKLNGTGYPMRLKGEQISQATRIVTVADIFDALTADRPYRKAMATGDALAILNKDRDIGLDGRCIDALVTGLEQTIAIAA